METVSTLAHLIGAVIGLAVMALAMTVMVYLGSWILRRRKLTGAQFWSMFGVTCVVYLILIAMGRLLD